MRKRGKAKVVWLPMDLENRLGVAPAVATSGVQSSTIIKIFTAPPLGDPFLTEEIPIVKDFAGGPGGLVATQGATLADLEQSGYRLRRIVGKLGFSAIQDNAIDPNGATTWHITAGFIIRRVNQDGNSTASGNSGPTGEQTSPSNLNNIADPWIWRRSWDLANRSDNALLVDPNAVSFRESNYLYGGGSYDGPHVDAKTARVVGPEERLFLTVSIEGINGNAQSPPGAVLLIGDIRVLASMRSNSGNRRNASR